MPAAKKAKPLPIPDAKPKKTRGGKRLRNLKERFGITEVSFSLLPNSASVCIAKFVRSGECGMQNGLIYV